MTSYLTRPVFPLDLNLVVGDQAWLFDDSATTIGLNGPATLSAQSFAKQKVQLTADDLDDVAREAVEEWLAALDTTARAMWFPCDLGEARIISVDDAPAGRVRIAGQDWVNGLPLASGMFLRLLSPAGEATLVQVVAVEAAGADEIITLDSMPAGLSPAWHVSRLLLARITSFKWLHTTEGRSNLTVAAVELPLEYAAPGTADATVRVDVWLYTLTRRVTQSDVLCWRMTSAPDAVSHGGQVYAPAQIDHDKLGSSTEGDTDALTLRLGVWPANPFLAWFPRHAQGSFGFVVDRVRVNRATATSEGSAVRVFRGEVANVERKAGVITVECKSPLAFSTTRVPGFMLQTFCNYALYDANTCGVVEAGYKLTGTVEAVDSAAATVDFESAGLAGKSADWLLRGYIAITTDGIEQETRFVRSAAVLSGTRHRLTLNMPTSLAIVGAAAVASPGCDKSVTMCHGRFGNRNKFGGHPFLPSYNPSVAAIKPATASGAGKK